MATVDIARQAFPFPLTMDKERINLSMRRLDNNGDYVEWVRIMTSAWPTLADDESLSLGEVQFPSEVGPDDRATRTFS